MKGRTNTHGRGGTSLNFDVRAYATEAALLAAMPKENTIGIITETKITSYIFAATEPMEPAEGMVWITTGISSAFEFNALEENALQVYPLSAQQYVGGAWNNLSCAIYQNGEWAAWWNGQLYEYGDKWETFTGGLATYAYRPSTSSSTAKKPIYSEDEDSITLSFGSSTSGGSLFVENAIDLTNYKTINIEVEAFSNSADSNYIRFGATLTKKDSYTVAAAKTISGKGITQCDISSLTGDHFLFINLYGSESKSITFTRWWLE